MCLCIGPYDHLSIVYPIFHLATTWKSSNFTYSAQLNVFDLGHFTTFVNFPDCIHTEKCKIFKLATFPKSCMKAPFSNEFEVNFFTLRVFLYIIAFLVHRILNLI